MPRPYIFGRARAQLAPLASFTCGAALCFPALTGAAVTTGTSQGVAPEAPAAGMAPDGGLSAPAAIPVAGGVTTLPGPAETLTGGSTTAAGTPPRVRPQLRLSRVGLNVLVGSAAGVAGRLRPARAGETVYLQRRARHGWRTIAHTRTEARGRFLLRYTPRELLSEPVRVLVAGAAGELPLAHGLGLLDSYRLALASWYGGSGSLACGGWLTSSTMGVANRTLPCGTLVTLRYGGRSVRVPVVDRGPFVAGREFDLTEATKNALGFEGVGEVWSSR